MGQLAADAAGRLDALELPSVHFCGLSSGGMVGQVLGARHGHRLRSLTLCDSAAYLPDKAEWDQRLAAARKVGMAALAEGMVGRWLANPGENRVAAAVQSLRETIGSTPVQGFCSCAAAVREMDNRPLLGQVKVPTRVIVGKEDRLTTAEDARFLHEHIAGSAMSILENSSHLCNMEQPDAFNAVLLAHLKNPG